MDARALTHRLRKEGAMNAGFMNDGQNLDYSKQIVTSN